MDPEKQRLIASMGGKATPAHKRSFSTDNALASAAGRKGGLAVKPENRNFAKNRELAVAAGRKGGLAGRGSKRRGA